MTSAGPVWRADSGPEDAPRMVLVHGTLDRSAGLLRLSRRLTDQFLVSRYDRRGYGRSVAVGPPFAIDSQIADLADVVTAGPVPVTLFGHSFGGNVVLGLAARRPDLVQQVVVYESPLPWRDWWPRLSATDQARWDAAPAASAEQFLRSIIGDRLWDKMPASSRQDRRAEGTAMVAELASLRSAAPWTADQISVPVLTMHGEHGLEQHCEAMRVVAAETDGDCVVIEGADHFGPNTHAARVADAIKAFAHK